MATATDPIVVEVTRSGTVESTHLVDVAVVDGDGGLALSAGDPDHLAAFRSSVKPLQALVCLEQGWQPSGSAALAIASASHNGEPGHIEAARQILAASGLSEDLLRCPQVWPARADDIAGVPARRRVFHNCSGKHSAFLATCAARGWPFDSYLDPAHDLQRAILARVGAAMREEPRAILVDGCGAPTPVASLTGFARAFGSVADAPTVVSMLEHPFLVGGTDRLDSALLEAGVVTKAGAEGMSCLLIRKDQDMFAVALKGRDGSSRARGPAIALILEQLAPESLQGVRADLLSPPTLGAGEPVGSAVATGKLV